MYRYMPNRGSLPLDVAYINSLTSGTFVNIAGVISCSFQQPRTTKVGTFYLLLTIQGTIYLKHFVHLVLILHHER